MKKLFVHVYMCVCSRVRVCVCLFVCKTNILYINKNNGYLLFLAPKILVCSNAVMLSLRNTVLEQNYFNL